MTAKDHYDNHLGNFYSWMYGDFDAKQHEQEEFFRHNSITPQGVVQAIDLGAGHGLQTVSLIKLGFQVTAVDFNDQLLAQLKTNAAGHANIVKGELTAFLRQHQEDAGVITCMGDTITHLQNIDEVITMFKECNRILTDDGKLIISFREVTNDLVETNRFIPVKSDDSRIAICFLEYFADFVMVYDIVQERINGEWRQKVSCYPKLRMNLKTISNLLAETKFQILRAETIKGMLYLIA